MNTKNLWMAVLSGAVLTTLVSNLPFIDLVNLLCFAGFWASAIFAVWLYRRLDGSVTVSQGLRIGALTGLCAGILGFGLSFLGLAGLQGLINGVQQFVPADAAPGDVDIPGWGAIVFNLVGVLFNVIFGTIGGWIGGALFRTDRVKENPTVVTE
jgi:hypothetical protein